MKTAVIGCGRWGSFIAWYMDRLENEVLLYGRTTSKSMQQFNKSRSNGIIELPQSIKLTSNIEDIISSEIIIISIDSQGLRKLMAQLSEYDLSNKIFVLCMKGIEISTGKRLSEVVEEYTDETNSIAVWLGPGHVQEFYNGIPNCMVIDSKDEIIKEKLVNSFSSELIRIYYGDDIIGNEIGGATKNIIGIAAGMLDGLKLSSLKGALMSRGTREISRLITAIGGNEFSAYGLCHLGDYEATIFSEFSHNRKFGELIVQGNRFDKLAEGYYTVKAIMEIAKKVDVDLPICTAVYNVLYENAEPKEELGMLFMRSLKKEF